MLDQHHVPGVEERGPVGKFELLLGLFPDGSKHADGITGVQRIESALRLPLGKVREPYVRDWAALALGQLETIALALDEGLSFKIHGIGEGGLTGSV